MVLLLALAVGLGSGLIREQIPMLQELGSVIGGAVSGSFLWVVGVLNLVVLIRLLRLWRSPASPAHKHDHMEVLLRGRGFLNRLLAGRLKGSIRRSWHMYPLGILFGLGFDTASEIALLSMTAGAAVGNLPLPATLSLPLLFASGMSLMDTSDGVLMVKAYDWAFINPIRKIYYNITTTTLSVLIALSIGTIELIQVGTQLSGADGAFARRVQALDLSWLGYIIVAAFLLLWAVSVLIWNIGQRRARRGAANVSVHEHGDGNFHVHRHFDHD